MAVTERTILLLYVSFHQRLSAILGPPRNVGKMAPTTIIPISLQ